ncbi:NUDIX domain-containing protein [Nitrosospira lacus]|uniref:NUDIX hydrolase n=1 Tax=Nitrosospira lacus TaxID=1288494 RepID=A0A1W6SMC9_9PROT|nr:NUDIX domain-containing protein [Nitrosospira lacus]ARO86956.1 NUDIX domain-containing protein [Nitrosospira lacus]
MTPTSAGLLLYRLKTNHLEVLLVHPGGPFWAKKDLGAWSIAKGEYEEGEAPLQAALREFFEETGYRPTGPYLPLTARRQPSGKIIDVWAAESNWDASNLVSNTFSMEWPRGSGKIRDFPEVDRAEWFDIAEATRRILPGQLGFLQELHEKLTGCAAHFFNSFYE